MWIMVVLLRGLNVYKDVVVEGSIMKDLFIVCLLWVLLVLIIGWGLVFIDWVVFE